jgi:hypothetical protein
MTSAVAAYRLQKVSLVCCATVRARTFHMAGSSSKAATTAAAVSHRRLSISRMLDMGGMPSARNDRTPVRTINASKNSKLQAVAFDFEILIKSPSGDGNKSIDGGTATSSKTTPTTASADSSPKLITRPVADLDQINQVASLLKVDINSDEPTFKNPYKEPTLSLSKREYPASPYISHPPAASSSPPPPKQTLRQSAPHEDVRAKYARKLKGGLAGIELAKSQVEDSMAKGDAAGHLAARKIAMQETPCSNSRWMANFGASKLLTYLTHRSIRIALLPDPKRVGNTEQQQQEQDWMHDFQTQLKDVVIDVAAPSLQSSDAASLTKVLKESVLNELSMDPGLVLVVSDRDDYLKAAKDLGMLTCRLQPKNSRRVNVTAHYTSPSVEEVQEIVNEINGISFNAVLNR